MTYNDENDGNETINLIENIYDIHKGPNDYIQFNGLLIKNDKNNDSIYYNIFGSNNIINQKYTVQKDNKDLIQKVQNIQIKNEEKDNLIPSIYYFEDIIQKFQNKDNEKKRLRELLETIKFNEEKIENIKKKIQFLENKRRAPDDNNVFDIGLNQLIEKKVLVRKTEQNQIKRGKKAKNNTNNTYNRIHDKMKADNIIKKIKGKIFEYGIIFLNSLMNKNNKEEKLLYLDYKYINKTDRESNLKYLNMKLENLFSQDISSKYNTKEKNFNKNLIEKVLKENKDETIKFAFNLTLRDWLDLFTLKKSVKELLKESDKNIDCETIKKSISDINVFLNDIKEKNGEKYLTPFIVLLYNYERWFKIKRGRKMNKNNKSK